MTNPTVEAVLLASGGLDSTILAYYLINKGIGFIPVFVDYGQHFAKSEYEALVSVLPTEFPTRVKVLSVSDIYRDSRSKLMVKPNLWGEQVRDEDFYLPYRNLLLLTVGAAYAQSKNYSFLYAGFINSNRAQEIDASTDFLNQIAELFRDYGGVQVMTPFRDMTKAEVAKLGAGLGVPIGFTFSCHASSPIPCGACPNCVDRLQALEMLLQD